MTSCELSTPNSVSSLTSTLSLQSPYTSYPSQGFEKSGQLVRMITGIIIRAKYFVLILFVCLIGFASSFFILFENQDGLEIARRSPLMMLVYSYTILLNGFDVGDIDGSANFAMTLILSLTFTYFINIVMLNLLIAIMGDIFDQIQENARAEFLYGRAQIILEYEAKVTKSIENGQMNEAKVEEMFPKWLQVLVPGEGTQQTHKKWGGRIRALYDKIREVSDLISAGLNDVKNKQKDEGNILQKIEKKLDEAEKRRREDLMNLEVQIKKGLSLERRNNSEIKKLDEDETNAIKALEKKLEETETRREEDAKRLKQLLEKYEDIHKVLTASQDMKDKKEAELKVKEEAEPLSMSLPPPPQPSKSHSLKGPQSPSNQAKAKKKRKKNNNKKKGGKGEEGQGEGAG